VLVGRAGWTRLGQAPNVPADGYVLFIGTLEPRKNLGVLLDAYERLAARGGHVPPLRIAGGTGPAPALARSLGKPPLEGLVSYVGYVADDAREALFAGAGRSCCRRSTRGSAAALEAMSAASRWSSRTPARSRGRWPTPPSCSTPRSGCARRRAFPSRRDDTWARDRAAAGLAVRATTPGRRRPARWARYDDACARRTGRAAA
jgi:hypothetical protein